MKTVLYLTTSTSATGSMWRVIQALAAPDLKLLWLDDIFGKGQVTEANVRNWIPPEQDHVIYYNVPRFFNHDVDVSRYRFIVNARDPRDRLCNQYYWQFSHPRPHDTPEKTQERAETVRALGIDGWVAQMRNTKDYDHMEKVVARLAPEDWRFIGYAFYCLHFDEAVAKIAAMLEADLAALPPDRRAAIEAERIENLGENKRWIGQRWEGSDATPGRHRGELKPETIALLNKRFARALAFLKAVDDPRMGSLYD